VAAGADTEASDDNGSTPLPALLAAGAANNAIAWLGMLASGEWDGMRNRQVIVPADMLLGMAKYASEQAEEADELEANWRQSRQRARKAEQMLEGATGNLRALILGAAGEMARLRGVRQAVLQAPAEAALQQPGLQQQKRCRSPSLADQCAQQQQQQQQGGGGGRGERHCSGGSTELERRWEELLRRERAVEEKERELMNLRMHAD